MNVDENLDELRLGFRAQRCHHVVLPDLFEEDRATALRTQVDAAGFDKFYEPDRGRYERRPDLHDQPLFDELRTLAERLVERPLRHGSARWFRLRHRDYSVMKDDARERLLEDHVELTLDFSAGATGQAEIVYTDGYESWVVPQWPASLAIVERSQWLFRYQRYLNQAVEAAVIHRLRLSLPFAKPESRVG